MSKAYKIEEDSLHDLFQKSRAKVQMFAGGFGNGKTTAAVIKAIKLAKDYPGSNGLVARSTYPKLTQTIRKEFTNWIPKSWVKRDIDSKSNLIELTNGSVINFSHIAQTGKNTESSTSNLLSATYDWIVVDQIEDPEITQKDFDDLMGRLRGQTPYAGDDDTMPRTGPRWFIIMCNPTRNWVYKSLVKPVHDYKMGISNPNLFVNPNTGEPWIEIFEGSTYDNAANLEKDFIQGLEARYKGQMKSRFLEGGWEAYEGLIYPDYRQNMHMLDYEDMLELYERIIRFGGNRDNILEGYDHGVAKPACYLFGFTNPVGDVFIMDGFYEKEQSIATSSRMMRETRLKYGFGNGIQANSFHSAEDLKVLADPSIFRRVSGNATTVGTTTSGLFREQGIKMIRGNNDVLNGIAKVQSYLYIDPYHRHPIDTAIVGAPRIYFSKHLDFIDSEITDYYWKKDTAGEYEDTPTDKNDHAMDTIKYILSRRPRVATFRAGSKPSILPVKYSHWREQPEMAQASGKKHRYG